MSPAGLTVRAEAVGFPVLLRDLHILMLPMEGPLAVPVPVALNELVAFMAILGPEAWIPPPPSVSQGEP